MKSRLKVHSNFYVSIILICSIVFLTAINCSAECTWINKTGNLAGSKFTSLAIDKQNPDTIYVGSKGFLSKSTDGGVNWTKIFKVPGSKAVNFIAIDPKNSKIVFAATESGVFKSEDSGNTWQPCPLGVEKESVFSILIDSKNSDILFVGTETGIFRSEDAGKNWLRSSEGLSAVNIRCMDQNYLNPEIIFAAADNGFFKSEDGAKIWKKISSVNIDENGGEKEESESAVYPSWVSVDPINPDIVYLSTKNGLLKSAANGASWSVMPKAGLLSGNIKNLVLPSYNKGFIIASAENGIFRFSEEEGIWREFYKGLNSKEAVFAALSPGQDSLWLITKSGIYKSEGGIYEIKEKASDERAKSLLQNFSGEPSYHEIQEAAIRYAEVHPDKIEKWRNSAKMKALLPTLSFGIDRDKTSELHWDSGTNPDTWTIGPEDESTGWDITCAWDLGGLIWNDDQTNIDVRSKLMVQLRDDILDEVTHLYFERRRLQVDFLQNPPKDMDILLEKDLRLQELTAGIDAMTGGYLSAELARRKN